MFSVFEVPDMTRTVFCGNVMWVDIRHLVMSFSIQNRDFLMREPNDRDMGHNL